MRCNCGCNTCETKALTLNESVASIELLSESLRYHIDNNRPLTEHLYRAGSKKYFELFSEARYLYSRNIINLSGDDLEIINETDLGHFGILENNKKVPLDYPMLCEGEKMEYKKGDKLKVKLKNGKEFDSYSSNKGIAYGKIDGDRKPFSLDAVVNEAKKKKKNNKPIGKPMRSSSGGKAYKVYVRDPKTKKIKTIRFGSGGLKAKINNPKARQAFAKRHDCKNKKDKTKASYWSCRLPR